MPYEFLEDVAIADVAFRAWGRDLEETFVSAADAVMNAMVEDLNAIQLQERRTIEAANDALDLLLFDFLQELIYYKDAAQLLLRVQQVRIADQDGRYTLHADAAGEVLAPGRHRMRVDVKAVTLHHFSLTQTAEGWEASVILDV
jgi:SHS2 domain-containing protein